MRARHKYVIMALNYSGGEKFLVTTLSMYYFGLYKKKYCSSAELTIYSNRFPLEIRNINYQ